MMMPENKDPNGWLIPTCIIGGLILIAIILTLVGCGQVPQGTAQMRHKIFTDCMEMASKLPEGKRDNRASTISKCRDYSYYIIRRLENEGILSGEVK